MQLPRATRLLVRIAASGCICGQPWMTRAKSSTCWSNTDAVGAAVNAQAAQEAMRHAEIAGQPTFVTGDDTPAFSSFLIRLRKASNFNLFGPRLKVQAMDPVVVAPEHAAGRVHRGAQRVVGDGAHPIAGRKIKTGFASR